MKSFFVLCFSFTLNILIGQVQTSTITLIPVTNKDGSLVTYTLMRDQTNKNLWYYEPKGLRLTEKEVSLSKPKIVNGKVVNRVVTKVLPDFKIIKYQYYDEKAVNGIGQGGLLLLSFTFSAPPIEEKQMLDQIKVITNNKSATISCMRFSSSTYMMSPMIPEMFPKDFKFESKKGAISAANMALTLPLTDVGAAIIAKSGIALQFELEYDATNPPCGGSIKGSWDNVFKYHQEAKGIAAGVKHPSIDAKGKYNYGEIKQIMTEKMGLKIDEVDCIGADGSNPLIANALKEIQTAMLTPKQVGIASEIEKLQRILEQAQLKNKESGGVEKVIDDIATGINGLKLDLEASYGEQNIYQKKSGSISFQINRTTRSSYKTNIGGFLSLESYALDSFDINSVLSEINVDGEYPYACFTLPQLFDESSKITSVSITIRPPSGNSLDAQYTNKDGWVSGGKKVAFLSFPLIGYNKKDIEKLGFRADVNIISSFVNNNLYFKDVPVKALGRTSALDAINELFDRVTVDGSLCSYFKITKDQGDLDFIKVSFKRIDSNETIQNTLILKPQNIDGNYIEPGEAVLLVKKPVSNYIMNAEFAPKSNPNNIAYKNNGMLKESKIAFRDADWIQIATPATEETIIEKIIDGAKDLIKKN